MPEVIMILVIALVVFGPGKLPEVGKAIGKGMTEFRRATSMEFKDEPKPEPKSEPQPEPAKMETPKAETPATAPVQTAAKAEEKK